jgi:hypothetical protein
MPSANTNTNTKTTRRCRTRKDRRVHMLLLDVNFQPAPDWILSGHYGGKLAFEESNALMAFPMRTCSPFV